MFKAFINLSSDKAELLYTADEELNTSQELRGAGVWLREA